MVQAQHQGKDPSWKAVYTDAAFRKALFLAIAAAVPLALLLPVFFQHIEDTPGLLLNDPILRSIGPVDVTWITFTVLYGSLFLGLARAVRGPWLLVRGMHAYVFIMVFRMCTMQLLTLEPPPLMIPLIDPITAVFYPGNEPFRKDLFFSGHTATLALLVPLAKPGAQRWFFVLATATIGALVLLQHVHWTVDVIAAPVFVTLAWWAGGLSLRACGYRGA